MNRVVEASGGILWQRETVAVEFIQARTGCTKEEATEALKIWLRDGRVSWKRDPTAEELLHFLRIQPLPEDSPKFEISINMHELGAVLVRSRPLSKRAGGRPPTYNWKKAELALAAECKLKEGIPHTATLIGNGEPWLTPAAMYITFSTGRTVAQLIRS